MNRPAKHKGHKPKTKRAKRPPVCTAKDLRTRRSKRRKCRVVKRKPAAVKRPRTPVRPSPTGPVAAPPAAAPTPDAFPTAPPTTSPPTPPVPAAPVYQPADGLLTYDGPFGAAQAHRLLYRAGFGPRPGQAAEVAALGVRGAVDALMNPASVDRVGPGPTGSYLIDGRLDPRDRIGHMHLDALDRQVRSTDQLSERMALVLHDWFAVSDDSPADRRYVYDHIDMLRHRWRGSFRQLLLDVTEDPAMLQFLHNIENHKDAPNENFAREVMEVFALGADRGAYTETDVREMARAFTGFRYDRNDWFGAHNFRFDQTWHDQGGKTVFAGTSHELSGNLGWQDAINAIVDHPLHPSFVVRKLWSYFIPTEPTAVTQAELEALYRTSGEHLGPLVDAILVHPDLHAGAAMVKPPVVYTSGLLRALAQNISTDRWIELLRVAGQVIGFPPNVAGWNDRAWLNTSTHAARWTIAQEALRVPLGLPSASATTGLEDPERAADHALAFWDHPPLTAEVLETVRAAAREMAAGTLLGNGYASVHEFLVNQQNALRQLIAAAPDFQVC